MTFPQITNRDNAWSRSSLLLSHAFAPFNANSFQVPEAWFAGSLGGSRCHVRLLTHDNKPLTDAEGRYFKDHNPPYPYYEGAENLGKNGGLYNRLGRGYPDVAANGDNIAVFNGGEFGSSGGTSATVGKGPVGFINPVLYKNPSVLNDITNGTNPGCGTDGFSTAPG
ncbi:unnamed protein product [Aspergillus oryzae]|uniref:Unnamed protein product n=2 Tax=Aspergillus oryzae TaxID=5062 RepID=A0AAN5BYI4_ASPOZ|nr:unnamed protein product [Aspergillus oryzae]GMF96824.1 unnamed protein product [Aspergillus oryzae]GMG15254.1 unnamed protein product [Aspergillus oryzae]GMG30443.1 unnamed protein product [Aspergillus oryzae]GMG52835.1 unnamed protein product [Aspergillus oryzae var. brunneus]